LAAAIFSLLIHILGNYMKTNYQNYGLFFRFIDTFLPNGFRDINRQDPLLLELEKMMENNRQFFYIADVIQVKIIYVSNRSTQMIGTQPDTVTPETFFDIRHPDDAEKHIVLRGKIFRTAHELYNSGKGEMLLSCCTRMRNINNVYIPILSQCYFFYSEIPHKTVYMFEVYTEVDKYQKTLCGHHHYFGNDMSYFRYPDENLLKKGNIFSDRELEIIRLLAKGLSTKQISEMLFLSPFTVNTHRSNILQKSGKASVHELLSWLTELGRI
jgi:DNA-binding CsgD family transcriptional regulator